MKSPLFAIHLGREAYPCAEIQHGLTHRSSDPPRPARVSRLGVFPVILYATIAACLATQAAELPKHLALAREILQELIETDTTHSTGDTTKAAEALGKRLRASGLPAADIQVVGPDPRTRNLVVRYRGVGKRGPILLLGHLDVVEARREDWSLDPFKLTEKEGFFYGRGTADIKGCDSALVSALIRLRQEGFQPDRDLIVAFTAGEEGSAVNNGLNWILKNRRDLIEAAYCLNVDAGGPARSQGKAVGYHVQAAEKGYLTLRLEVHNRGGHSSQPRPDNAIYQLAHALVKLSALKFPVHLNEVTRDYFAKTSDAETGQLASDMKAVLENPPDPGAATRLSENPLYNSVLRTTLVATMLDAGHAENALPQNARATVNCRLAPGEVQAEIIAKIREVIEDEKVLVSVIEPAAPSPVSPLTAELSQALQKVVQSAWPKLPVVPVMSTGATDGRYLRQAGIPTYGVGLCFQDLDDFRAHGRDERLGVQDFYQGVDFAYALVKAVSSH